ncbi:MAG: pyruvate kinase [Planctomycetota bacterium]
MAIEKLSDISRTKTVATVGPASASVEMLGQLLNHGVDVFRLNMAHGSRQDHETAIKNIRTANQQTGRPSGILVDLAGPKIRLGQLHAEPLTIENGQTVFFDRGNSTPRGDVLTCSYEPLIDELKVGDAIVLADGLARLEVTALTGDQAKCVVVDGGTIRSRQGVNLPGTQLSIPALGEKDIDNAIWAATQDIQFVSLSFVRNADEIQQLRQLLDDHDCSASIVAKIEKQEALENLEEIVDATDVVMVARGDLGVEIAIEKTPLAQKQIIQVCSNYRKPVIVATQMLESMHNSKQPTRAEASDVANAILDGADACMLSGETAIGEYPIDAVKVMQRIMLETEETLHGKESSMSILESEEPDEVSEAIVFGAAQIAGLLEAKIVAIASSTGTTARLKSKQRDYIRTICFTNDDQVAKRMCIYWGIVPVLVDQAKLSLRDFVTEWVKTHGDAQVGEPLVIVADTDWMPGVHDAILVCRVV